MSDDDLIRRGDALQAVQDAYDDSLEPDLYDAATRIRAIPATDVLEAAKRALEAWKETYSSPSTEEEKRKQITALDKAMLALRVTLRAKHD